MTNSIDYFYSKIKNLLSGSKGKGEQISSVNNCYSVKSDVVVAILLFIIVLYTVTSILLL